ncbi:protoheme IX farnesyltransferase [Neorickettsia helminthoeca str. Oregon]|uniref:Protoheme IX farnesyltransferase n=1 Tax=Neorickettsia helminthoeca str. Oregon TaxID=1286528 RepID=X5HKH0_9RICK|nr:heme o synthase [Neorickettsia helminthoeca]AHX11534.1 protoheme IX farnesyltransferase [Neorickettsia helminthoeca str. Oregon]
MLSVIFGIDCPSLRDCFALLKPRVVALVTFTAITGVVLAYFSGYTTSLSSAMLAIVCTATGSGAAGALNMWYDNDIDAVMLRTRNRPIPQGRVSQLFALEFGLILAVLSVGIMAIAVNLLSALLLLVAIFYYSVVYTIWLKRRTSQNIVIGGAAGAFPPMIGWAAVSNSVGIESIILFLIIFLWTPPHFWALALKSSQDYKSVGIPMLPVTSGVKVTKIQILCYSVLLLATSILPYVLMFAGVIYAVTALILGFIFLYYAVAVYLDDNNCMQLFYFSVLYLFLIFGALIFDAAFVALLKIVI